MGVRPKGRLRLLRVRLTGLSVLFLRRRHRRKRTLAQALTGQGRSSSCKIWEAYIQTQEILHSYIRFHLGFHVLVTRKQPAAARAWRGFTPPNHPWGFGFGVRHPLRGGRGKPLAGGARISPTRDSGKERVDGAERPSTLVQVCHIRLTVASIPLSVNESA